MMFAEYIALCTRYIRFDTFHIAEYIALCMEYIRLFRALEKNLSSDTMNNEEDRGSPNLTSLVE
ncbi:hypothetical protein H5410_057833 [Solanum commersonii]|uniref:Uncharacterized protein n=1 Tax=Solanum commersonii TaxID=4109 RepID=A0A9J5WNZ1_SOLCO|nr:hypothetical protein H5410_057833 [Solanum commersonii]